MLIQIRHDLLIGVLFIALAALFGAEAHHLSFGSATRMGPGYFPMLLAGLLAAIGLVLVVRGWLTGERTQVRVSLRGLALVIVSPLVFGAVLVPLGFVPAVAATALLSTLASRQFRPVAALVTSLVLTVLCWAVFIRGLGLGLPAFGSWFAS